MSLVNFAVLSFDELLLKFFEIRMYLVVKLCRWKNQTVVP